MLNLIKKNLNQHLILMCLLLDMESNENTDKLINTTELMIISDLLSLRKFSSKFRKRRWGVHPIFKKRNQFGAYYTLFRDIVLEDRDFFYEYTRMTPECFSKLVHLIRNQIDPKGPNSSIFAEQRVLICIRFLITGDTFRSLRFQFLVGLETIRCIVNQVCYAIWTSLGPLYMKMPSEQEWKNIAVDFLRIWRMPNCIGAIDGKHVRIIQPANAGSEYYNYLKYNSIVLLGIVDAHCNIIFVDIGSKGSRSDGGIFSRSRLCQLIEEGRLNIPNPTPLPGTNILMPYYFIGDSAFRLAPNMLRPYAGALLPDDKDNFNKILSSARKSAENLFGRLYRKFRIYGTDIEEDPRHVGMYVGATCVLHNFTQMEDRGFPSFSDQGQDYETEPEDGPYYESEDREEIRNNLKDYLYQQFQENI